MTVLWNTFLEIYSILNSLSFIWSSFKYIGLLLILILNEYLEFQIYTLSYSMDTYTFKFSLNKLLWSLSLDEQTAFRSPQFHKFHLTQSARREYIRV